ncbi:MAG: hypothetical protein Q8P41_05890 [Pseudomonadota bacterium]|nr:hypothetical protein [Pseudomonadota bacterium]
MSAGELGTTNASYLAADRTWIVPELRLSVLPGGTHAISETEIARVHRAIAAAICADPRPLRPPEFEFLSDTAELPYSRVAADLQLHRSALTKWMSSGRDMPLTRSLWVKRLFLLRLFGPGLPQVRMSAADLLNDADLLRRLYSEILRMRLTFAVSEMDGPPGPSPRPAPIELGDTRLAESPPICFGRHTRPQRSLKKRAPVSRTYGARRSRR